MEALLAGVPAVPPRAGRRKTALRTFDCHAEVASTQWDALHRDPQLFDDDADCSIFLFAEGHSKRGPAFQIPSRDLIDRQCTPLLLASRATPGTSQSAANSQAPGKLESPKVELYLPAPHLSQRDDAFRWHLTTRNFFAWIRGKPLVGEYLGVALADLYERMRLWRPDATDVAEDVLIFADKMGYSQVEGNPDLALSMLYFGEGAKLRNVWMDAFAHCAGMNGLLSASIEFKPINEVTKSLITKKSLEMELHLDRAAHALGNFLEEELSAAHLGLGNPARQQLDIFRGFLISHHVAVHGYWPPPMQSTFAKDFYQNLYNEFSNLYNYLADKGPPNPWRFMNGGICVQQNIDSFNARQDYDPLPYSLPLLPEASHLNNMPMHKSIFNLRKGTKDGKASGISRSKPCLEQLREATNPDEFTATSPLVQQYILFENEQATKFHDKLSPVDTRKVRWLLIYGTLQTLISTITAPTEVRETQTVDYPLCISSAGLPGWEEISPVSSRSSAAYSSNSTTNSNSNSNANIYSDHGSSPDLTGPTSKESPLTPPLSIHPDCEKEDYFKYLPTSTANSPRTSTLDLTTVPSRSKAPANRASSFLRKASLRRKSNPLPSSAKPAEPPKLVYGRTLAELAYGDLTYGDPTTIPTLDEVSPTKREFRFPFSPQNERAEPSDELETEAFPATEAKDDTVVDETATTTITDPEPRSDAPDSNTRTEKGLGVPSFDDLQLLLPSNVNNDDPSSTHRAFHLPRRVTTDTSTDDQEIITDHSPTSSIPSLTFSHSSRGSRASSINDVVPDNSGYGGAITSDTRTTTPPRTAPTSRKNSLKRVRFDVPSLVLEDQEGEEIEDVLALREESISAETPTRKENMSDMVDRVMAGRPAPPAVYDGAQVEADMYRSLCV